MLKQVFYPTCDWSVVLQSQLLLAVKFAKYDNLDLYPVDNFTSFTEDHNGKIIFGRLEKPIGI